MNTNNNQLCNYNLVDKERKVLKTNNSILVIKPFYKDGLWVFNDERTGLVEEPFVAGADLFIEFSLKQFGFYENSKKGFLAVFSKIPFPGHQIELTFKEFKNTGTMYYTNFQNFRNHEDLNEIWLCPALNLYFVESPDKLFVQFKELI